MTFSVNGIKQEKTGKYTVEMLVCVDAPLLARKILEKMNILILSVKEFPKDKKTFGDIYFTIKQNFQDIDIVTKYVDIQEACNFFKIGPHAEFFELFRKRFDLFAFLERNLSCWSFHGLIYLFKYSGNYFFCWF